MTPVSGFTILRNGIRFDFPFLESWRSLLPLVDELVIAIGFSDDGTLFAAEEFARNEGQGKVRIIQTIWDDRADRGLVLSHQTNIALHSCQNDWCVYLQSDEVLHEDEISMLKSEIESAATSTEQPEAIVLNYKHFYGSYSVIQRTRSSYRREIRVIRKSSGAISVGDAQSFRKPDGEKLKAFLSQANVYHYGWVRPPEKMQEKTIAMDLLYQKDADTLSKQNYRYKRYWGLQTYRETHPKVMKDRIERKNWNWDLDHSEFIFQWKDAVKILLDLWERLTGYRLFEFKNYVLIKKGTSK